VTTAISVKPEIKIGGKTLEEFRASLPESHRKEGYRFFAWDFDILVIEILEARQRINAEIERLNCLWGSL
jgi:hypothetical protein